MTQLRIEVLHIRANEYLDQIRKLPDSRKKTYKLLQVNGSNKTMMAAAREYARMVAKGYRI